MLAEDAWGTPLVTGRASNGYVGVSTVTRTQYSGGHGCCRAEVQHRGILPSAQVQDKLLPVVELAAGELAVQHNKAGWSRTSRLHQSKWRSPRQHRLFLAKRLPLLTAGAGSAITVLAVHGHCFKACDGYKVAGCAGCFGAPRLPEAVHCQITRAACHACHCGCHGASGVPALLARDNGCGC